MHYEQIVARVDGREEVLYRTRNPKSADLFRRLVGNRKFHGGTLKTVSIFSSRPRPTGILQTFVFDAR